MKSYGIATGFQTSVCDLESVCPRCEALEEGLTASAANILVSSIASSGPAIETIAASTFHRQWTATRTSIQR